MSNPLIAPREDSTRWFSGVFLAEDVDSLMASFSGGGWIDPAIGGLAAGLDALAFVTDPLGQLVSWGVGWLIEHVKPLSDALDALAGDPDQIAAYARTWTNVAGAIDGARTTLHDGVAGQLTEWIGEAASAYRARSTEYEATLAALVKANTALGEITAGAGLLVATVRMLVRDLIADFVSVLAVRLWEWLAEEGLTFGLGTPLREDRDAGWLGMAGWMSDPTVRYQNEVRAYQQEIDYARSIGDQAAVDKLHELLRKEYEDIFGEAP